jgi:hypothetical protein
VAVPVRAVAPVAGTVAARQSAPVRVPVWLGKTAAARRTEDGRGGGRKAADESDGEEGRR